MYSRFCIIIITLICANLNGFALKLAPKSTSMTYDAPKDSVEVYLLQGEMLVDSLPREALSKMNRAQKLAIKYNMYEQEALASYILGQAHLNLNQYYEARKHLHHSLVYFNSSKKRERKAYILYNLALTEYFLTYYDAAIENFKNSAEVFKELGKEKDYANALQNLGLTYQSNNEILKAQGSYLEALEIYKKHKDYPSIAGIYQNLGILSYKAGNDSLAVKNYLQSIKYFEEQDNFKDIGISYSNIGLFYLRRNKPDISYDNFEKSLSYFTKANFPLGQMWALNNLGSSLAMCGESDEALECYTESLEIAKSLNNTEGFITNYSDMAKIYEQGGLYQKALSYQKLYAKLKDSLRNVRAQEKIFKIENLYESEFREKEIIQYQAQRKRKQIRTWAILGFVTIFILASLVMLSAIYQKKKAEKNLNEHKTNLERLVEKRTRELQKQISERKIAEESDKLKSAFLANMSHELRTPMNAIIAFSNFLREPNLPNEKHFEYLDHITTAGDSLLRLIDDIIDIAKIESRQLKLFIQPTNINRLLNELYKIFSELRLKDNKKQIRFNLVMDVKFNYIINTDSQRLKQVLTNLIENAFKYTDKGKIEIGCETNESAVTFFVSDTGIGIPKDKQDVIFNRFYQLNHVKDRRAGGTGLGLAISKNLVNLLGGKIWVESEGNNGSKFSIQIPVVSIKKQPNPGFHKEDKPTQIIRPGYNWNNITILVAEDEDLNYKVLDTCLSRTNANILRAKDGISAVEICKTQKVDLVLMDIQMPGMDGYEATQEIKRMNNRTPVIAQTSFAMTGERERCLQAGCDDFITKPLEIDTLLKKIEYFLKQSYS